MAARRPITAVAGVPEGEELRAEVERLLRETAEGLEEVKERLRRSREGHERP